MSVDFRTVARTPLQFQPQAAVGSEQSWTTASSSYANTSSALLQPAAANGNSGTRRQLLSTSISFEMPGRKSQSDTPNLQIASLTASRVAKGTNAWGERPQTAPAPRGGSGGERTRKTQSAASRRLWSGHSIGIQEQRSAAQWRPSDNAPAGSIDLVKRPAALRPSSAPAAAGVGGRIRLRRPAHVGSARPTRGGRAGSNNKMAQPVPAAVGSVVQRPWGLQPGQGGEKIAPQIFAKLAQLEAASAARHDDPSRRLQVCREMFELVIRQDMVHSAILQRIKIEYDAHVDETTAGGGTNGIGGSRLRGQPGDMRATSPGAAQRHADLQANYQHLGEEYRKVTSKLKSLHADHLILQEQYELLVRQQQNLLEQHEADLRTIDAQAARIHALENGEKADGEANQGPSLHHLHALERLVQELATELDEARNMERTALSELVQVRFHINRYRAHQNCR